MSDDPTKPAGEVTPDPPGGGAEPNGALARARAKLDPRKLDDVEARWMAGQSPRQIERECAEAWGIKRRQVRRYLAVVRKRAAEAYAAQTPEEHRARIEKLLFGAYTVAAVGSKFHPPDAKAMVQASRVLAEIAGALGPKQVQLTGKNGEPLAVNTTTRVVLMPALEVDPPAELEDGDASSGAD